jgi:hypothetical protein
MNSKIKEKSKGVLLFAFNSETIDYVNIADTNAKLITKYLNLPVTLITDDPTLPKFNYDKIIKIELNTNQNFRLTKDRGTISWNNYDRFIAYDLTPYDETLVLDADYMIFDSNLLKLFEIDFDYKVQYNVITPNGPAYNKMGPLALDQVWATIFIFRKTATSEQFFKLISRIQENYDYYRALFSIRDGNFRNDFAFSIANIIINGYAVDPTKNLPWATFTIEDDINRIELNNNTFIIRHKESAVVTPVQNIHFMDKRFLLEEQFQNFVEELLNAK